jgi:broad specificity phosphatase PhoE
MKKFFLLFLAFFRVLFGNEMEFKNESSSPTIFYFVRHGQTDWNVQSKIQGQSDIPLNDTGRTEAFQLSEKLNPIIFDACFSSDLQRAIETAQILNTSRFLNLRTDPRLRERNLCSWEGVFGPEFIAFLKQKQQWPPSVENDEAMQKRVFSFMNETAELYPGSNVLVVTHGGVIKILLAQLLSIDFSSRFDIQIENAAFLRLTVSNGRCEIQDMQGIQFPL